MIQNNYRPYQDAFDLIQTASDLEIEAMALEISIRAFIADDTHIMDTYIELKNVAKTDKQKNIIEHLQQNCTDVPSAMDRLGVLCDKMLALSERAGMLHKSICN